MTTTRALGPGAAFGWITRAANLGRGNPRAVFGAVALLAVVALVPSVLQLALQYGFKLGPDQMLWVIGLIALLMMAVYPLLIGGLLRVIDDAEHGRPTRPAALFDTFRAGQGAGRLVGFGLILGVAYLGTFLVVIALFGPGLATWYMQLIAASAEPDNAAAMQTAMQTMPDGLGMVMALGTLAGMLFGGMYAIGFGQVAINDRSVGGALGDALAGTLKNLLPILVLAVVAFFGLLAFVIVVGLLLVLLGGIGGLVHPMLSLALMLPVYLLMVLVLYVVLFGVMYFMWRDICAAPEVDAGDRLAV